MTTTPRRPPRPWMALALAVAVVLGGCATRPDPTDPEAVAEFEQNNDPIEPWNRAMFFVNDGIDTLVLRPAAEAYRFFIAPEVRTGVRNVLRNLGSPVVLANDLMQGNLEGGATTAGRFLLNSTLGVGGVFDVATRLGLVGHSADFGQTMALWGSPDGLYLFLPVLGPSNPRDLTGFVVDNALQPLSWIQGGETFDLILVTRGVLSGVDTREGLIEPLEALRAASLDPYASVRSAFRQRRQAEIRNARDRAAQPLPGTAAARAAAPAQAAPRAP